MYSLLRVKSSKFGKSVVGRCPFDLTSGRRLPPEPVSTSILIKMERLMGMICQIYTTIKITFKLGFVRLGQKGPRAKRGQNLSKGPKGAKICQRGQKGPKVVKGAKICQRGQKGPKVVKGAKSCQRGQKLSKGPKVVKGAKSCERGQNLLKGPIRANHSLILTNSLTHSYLLIHSLSLTHSK